MGIRGKATEQNNHTSPTVVVENIPGIDFSQANVWMTRTQALQGGGAAADEETGVIRDRRSFILHMAALPGLPRVTLV